MRNWSITSTSSPLPKRRKNPDAESLPGRDGLGVDLKEKAAAAVVQEGALRGSWVLEGLPPEWAEGLEVGR